MQNIECILWDIDNTLYADTPEIKAVFKDAGTDAIRALVNQKLTNNEISEILDLSRELNGSSFGALAELGHTEKDLHALHHSLLGPALEMIRENKTLCDAFKDSKEHKPGLRFVVLTHGNKEHWAMPVLKKLGLGQYFDEKDVFSISEFDFKRKHEGPDVFEEVLDKIGVSPKKAALIDDRAKNLVHPHDMGMYTVLVHNGNPPAQTLPHADHQCATPEQALQHLLQGAKELENKPAPKRIP